MEAVAIALTGENPPDDAKLPRSQEDKCGIQKARAPRYFLTKTNFARQMTFYKILTANNMVDIGLFFSLQRETILKISVQFPVL